jgi:integrase
LRYRSNLPIPNQATNFLADHALHGDPCFREFITSLHVQTTIEYYTFALKRYMKFLGVEHPRNLVNKDPKLMQTDLIKYFVEDTSVKPVTKRSYLAVLKKFYIQNDVTEINWAKVSSKIHSSVRPHKDRAYTNEEIAKLLDNADKRSRVIVLLLASSGMRVGALPQLKIMDLKPVMAGDQKLYEITAYSGDKEEQITFCTPECATAIDDYLRFREARGELLSPDTPIIREQFNTEDLLKIQRPKKLDVTSIQRIINELILRAGLRGRKAMIEGQRHGTTRHEVRACHGFRKWFNTVLKNSNVNPLFTEIWLGHKIGLEPAYLRSSETDHLKEYLKAIPHLTIREENRLKTKVEELTKEKIVYKDFLEKRIAFLEKGQRLTTEINKEYMRKIKQDRFTINELASRLADKDPKFKRDYERVFGNAPDVSTDRKPSTEEE